MPSRQTTDNDSMAADSCVVGSLTSWPLAEVLLWMHQSRRTGMIRIGTGLDAGVLFFRDGHLLRCEWRSAAGEEALIGLLSLTDGHFSLMQRAVPDVRPNIFRPTAELLLQCTIALDERQRPRAV